MSGVTLSQPDITLLLDLDGIIRGATLADGLSSGMSDGNISSWVGRRWVDTVDEGDKVRRILADVHSSGMSAYSTVNQRFPGGLELPMEYATVRVADGGLIAIGRNQTTVAELQNRLIAAQQAREQDYWKLREVETRYRMLFDTSSEVVLVIRADGFRLVEANLAALRTLSLTPGQDLLPELPAAEHEAFRTMLARVRAQGRAPGIVVHLGQSREAWTMRASLMSTEPGAEQAQVFMLQLAPLVAPDAAMPAGLQTAPHNGGAMPFDALLQHLPDSFVVVDPQGIILGANPAFLDLVQVGVAGSLRGERLGRWLSRPGADAAVLLATVQRHRFVRLFSTTLQGEHQMEIQVEISAAGDSETHPRCIGLLIRDVSRRMSQPAIASSGASVVSVSNTSGGNTLLAALGTMAETLGQTSLPTLIKETVSLVERHYIEEALEMAKGNRTATAELLGLSRQSLYMKLNRYGLDTESVAADLLTSGTAMAAEDGA